MKGAPIVTKTALSARKARFAAALLATNTVADAARAAGISERTAFTYLEDPDVQSAVGRGLDDTLSDATLHVTAAVTKALAVLESILDDTSAPPSCRVAAARLILDAGPRYRQTLDLATRLAVVEDLQRSRQDGFEA
jgi:hypothetical protein